MTDEEQRKHEELRTLYDETEQRLNRASNLVAALQIVAYDVCQLSPEDAIGKERRDAIVGLGDALEELLSN